jgi:hypothetical protein
VALYAYRGFFHSPSARPDAAGVLPSVTYFYPALAVYGASLQRNALGGVISAEGAYQHSREDADGLDPFVPNSSAKWLAGYQRELVADFTIGAQYIGELMTNYGAYETSLPPGFPRVDAYRQTVTLRATLFLSNQALRISAFAFYGVTERDFLVMPEVGYKLSDRFSIVLGSNIFGGTHPRTTFASFNDDSNVYSWARLTY